MRDWRNHARSTLLLLSISAVLVNPASAEPENNDEALRELRNRIERLQQQMDSTRDERDAARNALRPIERRISRQLRELKKTNTELRTANQKLHQLQRKRVAARQRLGRQRAELASHAQTAYTLGRQDYLKLLLNQQDPAAFSRVMTYYRYFTEARANDIQGLQADLAQLTRLETSISRRTRQLEAVKARHARETSALEQSRSTRAVVVASLNKELRTQQNEISRLKRDQRRLDNLLVDLPDVSFPTNASGTFRSHRGRLPLPVSGRVTARFGTRRQQGDLKWKGIFLATGGGREVKSIFGGRVVYADWLSGYGLLLILEHGDGYMTLYGNNESLYPQVGDRVEAGQVIAVTGNTGNIARTGLYFEVRHQGRPHDPLRWCRRG
jgi:septal ring factor EnvC (AmiA/AmiB activator)